jgi:hypothetical protein
MGRGISTRKPETVTAGIARGDDEWNATTETMVAERFIEILSVDAK